MSTTTPEKKLSDAELADMIWNKRRRALYERLLADKEFVEIELEGRLQETVDEEAKHMSAEKDPAQVLAKKERWLLAKEMREHYEKTLKNYRAHDEVQRQAEAQAAKGVRPGDDE